MRLFNRKKETKYIFDRIKEALDTNEELPSTFDLASNQNDNTVRFAPGAMDGIGIYHTNMDMNEDEQKCEFYSLFKTYAQHQNEKYKQTIIDFIDEVNVVGVYESLLSTIRTHQDIEPSDVYKIAFDFMLHTNHIELVKLGIVLTSLLSIDCTSEMYNVVFTLGMYDEFTLYSIVAFLNWDEGNESIFLLAQKVHGWGKIHAVTNLKPDTKGKQDWIIVEGCKNNIMPSYLGIVCAQKGDMIAYLRLEELQPKEFDGITYIIDALLSVGPVVGIEGYEDIQEAIHLYIHHAYTQCNSLEQLETISSIFNWLKVNHPNNQSDIMLCETILNQPKWRQEILNTLENADQRVYFACDIADTLRMDIREPLFQCIKKKPFEYCGFTVRLYIDEEYAIKVTNLYEQILPRNEVATGMGDLLGLGKEFQYHSCIDFILQGIENYYNMGESLVLCALQSPVIRNRNGACNVLEAWKKLDIMMIQPFIKEIEKLIPIEVNDDLIERYKALLA